MLFKTFETTTKINKPIAEVWRVLSSLESYGNWNSATRFSGKPEVNRWLLMKVKLFGLWGVVPVKIQSLCSDEGVRWMGGIPLLVTGSHYFKLIEDGDGTTELIQGEDFKGLLVPLLIPLLKKELLALYQDFNDSFKQFCESAQS